MTDMLVDIGFILVQLICAVALMVTCFKLFIARARKVSPDRVKNCIYTVLLLVLVTAIIYGG
jgi:hypothetical protein